MTRQADPKSTGYFSVKARNETEHQLIGDLKRLACQDNKELADLIFEGIRQVLKTHHWPPNNPQKQLTIFQKDQNHLDNNNICACGRPIEVIFSRWQDKKAYKCCKYCFDKIPRAHLQYWKLLPKK
ncbi:MAG: hypothetical protein LBI79_05530 [Nitrososphaerota archaeon]|jgi:hypothetical protein|nr:hypothetical protein [Nitrososphaerota archaeon]